MRGLRDGVWRSWRERKHWGVGCFLGGRREEEPAVKEGERKREGKMLETIRDCFQEGKVECVFTAAAVSPLASQRVF